jgi:charged multivesicular body protein 3
MEEMMEDTLNMDEDEEIEEEADAEVDKVLFELTNGKLGEAGSVGTELPVLFYVHLFRRSLADRETLQPLQDNLEEEETERTMEKYRQQLNGLLS